MEREGKRYDGWERKEVDGKRRAGGKGNIKKEKRVKDEAALEIKVING